MHVFLTGSTGYVGSFILQDLLAAGHRVRCLVRSPHPAKAAASAGVEYVVGDITRPDTLLDIMADCEVIIHLVAIIKEKPGKGITFEKVNLEATKNMIQAAKVQGVQRFLHMSALGADPNGATAYLRTKGRAEAHVRQSGLDYTIFRPSFIFGPGDAVFSLLARTILLSPFGVVPVFGSGNYQHQPVSVYNVSQGFVRAMEKSKTERATFDVGGPEPLTYNQQLEIIGRVIGKSVHRITLPLPVAKFLVRSIEWLPFSPIDSDQLKMLTLNNTCDPHAFASDLDIELTPFETGLEECMKSKNLPGSP
jgi:uncharacterized protein YbjT (DUF2867 family)